MVKRQGGRQAGASFIKKAGAFIKSTGLVGKAAAALAPVVGKAASGVLGAEAGSAISSLGTAGANALKNRGWGLSGGAFGHRMAGRSRKTSKTGKEYPANVGSNAQVWHGTKEKTPGGLTKNDLMKTSQGRLVSKKKHAQGLKQFNKPGVKEAFQARMFKKG